MDFRGWFNKLFGGGQPQNDDALKSYRYGNFCGPGPYLDAQTCDRLRTGGSLPAPVNQTDAQCRQHDIDYCKCGVGSTAGFPGFGTGCSARADRRLVASILGKLKRGQITDPTELLAARIIATYFRLKGTLRGLNL